MKKLGIRLDPSMHSIAETNCAELDEVIADIGEVIGGRTVGVGILALQMCYIIVANGLSAEDRADAITCARQFFELNEVPVEIMVQ
jgi:hypothetical protein